MKEVSFAGSAEGDDSDELLHDTLSPPSNELPVTVAFDAELLAADGYSLSCAGLHVYSTGFRIGLQLRARDRREGNALFEVLHRGGPEAVLVGVEYADGRWGRHVGWGARDRGHTGEVIVLSQGGGGDDRAVEHDFFVSPLPPPGPAAIVCAWPARGLGDRVTALPVDEIAAAAQRVRRLWPRQAQQAATPPEPESPAVPEGSWFDR